jgi:putative thiamine transport system substrate-binding protein
MVRHAVAAFVLLLGLVAGAATRAQSPDPAALGSWDEIVARAAGQEVYFNAWGGDAKINDYIAWTGEQVQARYAITLHHVKVADTAEVVTRVLAEKTAGVLSGGSVDLVWINGENFATMKANGLLFGPFTELTPNYALVDTARLPTTLADFTVPVDGMEAPWGMAQLVLIYDSARLADPPRSPAALLDWLREHPGRFTYPQPPDFIGTSFLKQMLYGLGADRDALGRAVPDDAAAAAITAALWTWLEQLTPLLWLGGGSYPANYPELRQLLNDGEIDIAMAFNPGEASAAITQGLLPETVRTYVFNGGSLANTHFVAIPFNASAPEAAMVVADFLMSAEAQARKQDPGVWGDPTVLAVDRLSEPDRALFDALPLGIATLAPAELGPTLPEPHPSWAGWLEAEWQRRMYR